MSRSYEQRIHALTDAVRKHQRSLANFAWACLSVRTNRPNVQDVEDVLSDAYLVAATKLRGDPALEINNFEAWFRKILFFRCLKNAKKYRIENWSKTVEEIETEDEILEVQRDPTGMEFKLLIHELLEKLGKKDREIVEMAAEGHTSEQIGKSLGESPEVVRKRKSRALQALRKIL